MTSSTWRSYADRVLAELFENGKRQPTDREIFDAYPFGERANHPYKMWCEQVKWWKEGRPLKAQKKRAPVVSPEQEMLL